MSAIRTLCPALLTATLLGLASYGNVAQAEEGVATGSTGLSASARIRFRIVVPPVVTIERDADGSLSIASNAGPMTLASASDPAARGVLMARAPAVEMRGGDGIGRDLVVAVP